MDSWQKAQDWEKQWWGNCANTLGEEMKQLVYANRMGLIQTRDNSTPYRFDMGGRSVLDIGGGPVSLLLKCVNVKGKVIDSLQFPKWIEERYKLAEIEFERIKAEDITEGGWDEVWIYNVLQHVEDPKKVIVNIRKAAKIIRVFEWLDIPLSTGHIRSLTEEKLNSSLRGEGKIENLTGQNQCFGRAYYGIFIGKKT